MTLTDVICDLDGVIYKGDVVIPGAARGLTNLADAGVRVTFVTNNSTRSPQRTAEKITRITGVPVEAGQVVTSSQAAASMLSEPDWPALAVGEEGVTAALEDAGIPTTTDPSVARSVVVGMYWGVTYRDMADAADAVRSGARFVATNSDPTYPDADRLLPGAGALVAAIATAAGRSPEVAGKPHQPIRDLLVSRGIEEAWVIGDRVDTDIALAAGDSRWRSILVLSGVTDSAEAEGQADHVVADFAAASDLVLRHTLRQ